MASGPIAPWQIDGKTMETVTDIFLGGSKITADGDCSHEIKTLSPWMESYDQPTQHIKKQRLCPSSQSYVFPVVMYGYQSWTIKKAECRRTDAFELWHCRRLLRVPWTARRSNKSILKEISPEYSLEGLMLKLKLQYFDHLMLRTDSLEKILMLRKIEGGRRRGDRGWDGWMASPTQWKWVWVNPGIWWWKRSLVCCSPWSHRVGHERLNWTVRPATTNN